MNTFRHCNNSTPGWRLAALAGTVSIALLIGSAGAFGADGEGNVFRRNVSHSPSEPSAKAKLGFSASAYAEAASTNSDLQGLVLLDPPDADGVCEVGYPDPDPDEDVCLAQPLVVSYVKGGETPAAVSMDDGASWKRNNLSHATDKTVSVVASDENGEVTETLTWPGYTKKPALAMVGRNILVAWTSNLCQGGSGGLQDGNQGEVPGEGDPSDNFQVKGRQGYVDYAELDRPDLGKEAYSCVWTARGVVEDDGSVTWRAPERLTSGRRDAYQLSAAFSGAGFVLAWQEDPEGLQPGEAKGPGHGMSGANVSKKTDIWYSYLPMGKNSSVFQAICADDDCQTNGVQDGYGDGKPKVENLFSSPVPISDNAPCQVELDEDGEILHDDDGDLIVHGAPVCGSMCDEGNLAEAKDNGRVPCMKGDVALDGDTGASRPNIFMIGSKVSIGYEETKGVGGGPNDDPKPEEADDEGKNVVYHHFTSFKAPPTLDPGTILNLPELGKNGKPVVTESGVVVLYREGPDGKGRQADIMMRRAVGGYAPENFSCDLNWKLTGNNGSKGDKICIRGARNLSSPQHQMLDMDTSGGTPKVIDWKYHAYNLLDTHKDNPYDDARAHRGILRGDFLMVGYTWTPNWAAGRNGKDTYDFYARRSFDAGESFTNLKGLFEEPRNLSGLRNNLGRHLQAIEPRLVATPGSWSGSPGNPDDTQNRMMVFAAYGTATNVDLDYGDPVPQDIYYSWTDNLGETYRLVLNDNSGRWEFDWLANSTPNNGVEAGEAQLRTNPAGTKLFATWLAESDVAGPCATGQPAGSDICFRKIEGVGPLSRYDANDDGSLDFLDEALLGDALKKYDETFDYNEDGKVDKTVDLVLWQEAHNQYCKRPDADPMACP